MKQRIAAALLALASTQVATLSGCAATGEVRMERVRLRDALIAVGKEGLPCYQHLTTMPNYAVLHERLAVDTANLPTQVQLADSETPAPDIVQLGMEWYAENQVCTRGTVEGLARIDPELGVASTGWLIEIADIYQDVLTNRPTYGHINGRLKHLKERQQTDLRQWASNLDARLKRQQEREEAQALEDSRRYTATIGAVSEFAANALVAAVQLLAARQSSLYQAQRQYVLVVPSYRPVRITQTSCSYVAKVFTCRQVSF